jgi:hypothetical protein
MVQLSGCGDSLLEHWPLHASASDSLLGEKIQTETFPLAPPSPVIYKYGFDPGV